MARRLTTLWVAAAALLALALPAAAGAAPQLVDGGKALAKGAKFHLTSTNALITRTAVGTVACQDLTMGMEVTANTGAHVEANSFVGAKDACLVNGGPEKVNLREPTLIGMTSKEKDEGTVKITFVVEIGPFECHFEGKGRFHYMTKTDVLKIGGEGADQGIVLTAAPGLCEGEEGQAIFHGEFTMYTEDLSPVTIE